MVAKAETLFNGIRKLAQAGQLDRQSMITIGPKIGLYRSLVPFYGGGENDATYFKRIQEAIRTKEGLETFKKFYETLNPESRKDIGKTINEVRIHYS